MNRLRTTVFAAALFVCSVRFVLWSAAVPSGTSARLPPSFGGTVAPFVPRGGDASTSNAPESFLQLAKALRGKLRAKESGISDVRLVKALQDISTSQTALKGIDGAAHEAYQRTHSTDKDTVDTTVAGRAQRSAQRIGAVAEALMACELVELVRNPTLIDEHGVLSGRRVVMNVTGTSNETIQLGKTSHLTALVLYEPDYHGGAGLDHGSIKSLVENSRSPTEPRGRIIVVLNTEPKETLREIVRILAKKTKKIRLASGLVADEVASVQPLLYKAAVELLLILRPTLQDPRYRSCAVHFVGHSLSGSIAALAATILDGTLPFPKDTFRGERSNKQKPASSSRTSEERTTQSVSDNARSDPSAEGGEDGKDASALEQSEPTGSNRTVTNKLTRNATDDSKTLPYGGIGRGRTSAVCLGPAPCLSSNVLAAYCTSFLYGDDIVCRTSGETVDKLCERVHSKLQSRLVPNRIGWMADTVSMTVSNLRTHAHGSEGEEATLAVPGRAYLLRPRRLGGSCSIHDVGSLQKGGREALRARLLWQLNDILLSRSLWIHHDLESYISGLDRVQLRGISDGQEDLAY